MHEIFNNPLWWLIPFIILASFLVNHKVELPHKKDDSDSSKGQDKKDDKSDNDSK